MAFLCLPAWNQSLRAKPKDNEFCACESRRKNGAKGHHSQINPNSNIDDACLLGTLVSRIDCLQVLFLLLLFVKEPHFRSIHEQLTVCCLDK